MISALRRLGLFLLLASLLSGAASAAGDHSALSVVEGTVLEVGTLPGEGGLELVTARLSTQQPGSGELDLLLAPRSVLEETGFAVKPGDRLKARVFIADESPAMVHKVRNISQGSMVRLRTLRQIPLWDGTGVWQGGPGQGRGHGRHQGPKHGQQGGSGPPR